MDALTGSVRAIESFSLLAGNDNFYYSLGLRADLY